MRRVEIEWPAGSGRRVGGEEIEWTVKSGEKWSQYVAADGTKLRVKTLLMRVVRLDDRDTEGCPIYVLFTSNQIIVQAQPHMMVTEAARPTTPQGGDKENP
jgi:hypothetical protein